MHSLAGLPGQNLNHQGGGGRSSRTEPAVLPSSHTDLKGLVQNGIGEKYFASQQILEVKEMSSRLQH